MWHKGLLFKLKSILPPYYYLLFKSYLENRHFSIRSGFSLSEISPIQAGVPQGSVAAPLLFNLFTSDQPTTPSTNYNWRLCRWQGSSSRPLWSWPSLKPPPKTISIYYPLGIRLGDKSQQSKIHPLYIDSQQIVCSPIYLNNVPLPFAQNVRYLGLHLERQLTWAIHTHTKRLALNNHSRLLHYLLTSQHRNLKNKFFLYKLLVKPIWTYSIQLWGAAKPSNLNKIQIIQSKCLRQITKALYYVSNDTLHRDLVIPTVPNIAKTFYKRLHSKFHNHIGNPLIYELSTNAILGDPRRRLKLTWCLNLLN